jgi:endonuclease/exonuclease/phosphatase family metal-dependent hydrolase
VRLLTYNIRSMRDDWHAAAAVIRACEPDVVCIQEAPRFLRWRSKRAALAREAGLVVATADRVGGLMLLTALRTDVVRTSHTALSKRPRLHQRAVVAAEVKVAGERWTVASVHLSLDDDERVLHVAEVVAALSSYDAPVVVAGDINERPDGPVWHDFATRWQDAYVVAPWGEGDTYSATRPHKRIDGIFTDHSVEVVSCGVPDVPGITVASDHRPVLAVLRQA